MTTVYKIVPAALWREAERDGVFRGAAIDLRDGYIHLSTAPQLPGTLARHFAGESGLRLLALDSDALPELRWEPSRGGDLFPHLYREMRASDVIFARPLPLGPEGHDIGDLA